MTDEPDRRTALRMGAVLAAATAGTLGIGCAQPAAPSPGPLKWSRGNELPRLRMPALACDCHHHIYDSRYPFAPQATLKPGDATVDDYRVLQARIGTRRNVIVQPSSYGTDNRLLVEALGQFGGQARGVAVVNPSVTDAELQQMQQAGVRGIRFNLAPPGTTTLDMVRPLAARIAPLGWHVQVNAPAPALLEARATWSELPVPVVFDHLARVPYPEGVRHPVFAMVTELMRQQKAYVKLSGFYADSKAGPPDYPDAVEVARGFAQAEPGRCLWGSDWPHPTEQPDRIPDDAALVDAFAKAVPDEAVRQRILVANPARLYQFS